MKKLMKSVLACLLAFAMVLTVMPVNSYAAAKKSVVVTNQKQLEKALKNGATNIVIKTNKNVKITIPATKKAAKASISIQAKNATITNKASVKSIVIKDAKAFVESGKNNDIKITDSKLSLTVAKGSKGADIKVAKKDAEIKVVAKGDVASVTVAKTADVTLTVNKTATVASVNVAAKGASVDLNAKGTVSDVKVSEKAADTKLNINASGKVENVQIDAKADVAVAGSTTEAVKVTVNAKDTTIKAETVVETTLNADAKVDLSKGAEGSKVTTAENVKVDVANNTEDKVIVTDSTGKETSVDAGKTETTKDESKKDDEKKDDQKKDDQSSGGSSGGSSGTVTPTPTPTPDPTPTHEPGVEFSSSNEPLLGSVSYNEEREKLELTVTFEPGERVWGNDGKELDSWDVEINKISGQKNGMSLSSIDFAGEDDEIVTAIFDLKLNSQSGEDSLQFDYEVYNDSSLSDLLGKKTFTVKYEVSQDALDKITVPYATEIRVIAKNKLYVDFSQDVRNTKDGIKIDVKKVGGSQVIKVADIKKDEEQWQRYEITFAEDLEDGEYTVETSFYDKKNQAENAGFSYDQSVWTNMDAIKDAALELMEAGCSISDSSDQLPYSVIFQTELRKKLAEKKVSTENIEIQVEQHVEDDGTVWIMVYIKNGNAMYSLNGYVSFESK